MVANLILRQTSHFDALLFKLRLNKPSWQVYRPQAGFPKDYCCKFDIDIESLWTTCIEPKQALVDQMLTAADFSLLLLTFATAAECCWLVTRLDRGLLLPLTNNLRRFQSIKNLPPQFIHRFMREIPCEINRDIISPCFAICDADPRMNRLLICGKPYRQMGGGYHNNIHL